MKQRAIYALVATVVASLLTAGSIYFKTTGSPATTDTLAGKPKTSAETAVVPGPSMAVQIDSLKQQLSSEISKRRALEEKVEELGRQVVSLNEDILAISASMPAQEEEALVEETRTDNPADGAWFNTQALVEAGMDSQQANELRQFFEQQELDRLFLRDKSVREKWSREEFSQALSELSDKEDAMKAGLDETAYDAFLYATGQTNRVTVTSVLDSSQAGNAGIQPGDRIIRYDNQRIYDVFELREATTSGSLTDSVPVELERDGEVIEIYIGRGPMGVRLNPESIAPSG